MFRISENNGEKFKLHNKESTKEDESKAYEFDNIAISNITARASGIGISKNVIIASALP